MLGQAAVQAQACERREKGGREGERETHGKEVMRKSREPEKRETRVALATNTRRVERELGQKGAKEATDGLRQGLSVPLRILQMRGHPCTVMARWPRLSQPGEGHFTPATV